jgi:hypothetical protein
MDADRSAETVTSENRLETISGALPKSLFSNSARILRNGLFQKLLDPFVLSAR